MSFLRAVLNAKVVVAGLLWNGPPNCLLRAVGERLSLYSSRTLIDELAKTLARKKFAQRIALQGTDIDALIEHYLGLAELVVPPASRASPAIPTTIT